MNPQTTPTTSPITMSPISNMQDLQSMQATPTASPSLPTQITTQPSQNWFERLLPTIGSVAGYGIGALLAPETGGASLALGALGSALGQGAGKVGENLATGQSATSGVGGDVASGAVGGLLGGVGGSLVGKLGETLGGIGEKGIANAATKELGDESVNAANATNLNYGGIHSDVQGDLNLGTNQNFVDSMGMDSTNPYDMQKVSQAGNDLNSVYDNALQGADYVNTDNFTKALRTAQVKAGGDTTQNPINDAISDFNRVSGTNAGIVPKNMPATQARQLQQAIGRQIGNAEKIVNAAKMNGAYNGEMQGQLNDLHNLYDTLGTSIKTPAVNEAVANTTVSAADRAGYVAKYGNKLGNYVADTIDNAKDADSLLDPMQKFTQMGKASDMAINDIENVTGTPRAVARAKFAANGGVMPSETPAANPANLAQAAKHAAAGEHVKAAGQLMATLQDAGLGSKTASQAGNILQRLSVPTGAAITGAATIPEMAGAGGQQTMQNTAATQPTQQDPNQLNMMLQAAMLDPSQFGGVLTTLAPMVQQSQAEQGLLQNLQPAYQAAGGAQGFGGGILSRLQALIPGTPQYAYEQALKAAAAKGAQYGITPGMLPSLMANPQTAQQQMGGVQNVLQQMPV